MNLFLPFVPIVAVAGLGFCGALRHSKSSDSNPDSLNSNPQPTPASLRSSNDRLLASSMLQPA